MPRLFKTSHGDFPLSNAWWVHVDRVQQAVGGVTQEHAQQARKVMMDLSDERTRKFIEPVLSDEERALMGSGDRVYDLHTCAAFLGGTPLGTYGFATLCQVHGCRAGFPCGCEMHVIFDHHAPEKPQQGHRVLKNCEHHKHYDSRAKDLYAAILKDHKDN